MKKGNLNYHYIQNYNPPLAYGDVSLMQIGTAYCQANTNIAIHSHIDFFELTVVTSGKGRITTNNVSVPVEQGDIYVSFPYDRHSLDSGEESTMNYNFLAFFVHKPELLRDMEKLAALYKNPSERIIRNETISSLLTAAISETKKERAYQQEYLEALFSQIVIQIIRAFNKQYSVASAPSKREELCYQVMDYINSNIYSIRSLSELSEHFSYDYTYISKIFTQTTTQSISEYYRFQRLEVARDLIRQDELKLTEIAEKLNYSSIYSFSKAFKQQYLVSPRAYKKSLFEENVKDSESNEA